VIQAASCLGILDDCQLQSAVEERLGVDSLYQIPDTLWERIEPLVPPHEKKTKRGRPRMDDRKAMNGIFYVLRTGCQWKALPHSLGRKSTVHDRFQEWRKAGVFEGMWRESLLEYDATKGIDWEWQSMDAAMTKAPLGGKKHGAEPHR
jgi:putative transposase